MNSLRKIFFFSATNQRSWLPRALSFRRRKKERGKVHSFLGLSSAPATDKVGRHSCARAAKFQSSTIGTGDFILEEGIADEGFRHRPALAWESLPEPETPG